MPFGTQFVMLLTLMLTSKGVAGVPRASLVILAGTLATFNLPVEGVAVILGVDTLMDMARTSVNLLGNCLATAVVARWEGVDLYKAEADAEAEAELKAQGHCVMRGRHSCLPLEFLFQVGAWGIVPLWESNLKNLVDIRRRYPVAIRN